MDKKLALLVIYNHRYDKNIPRVEALYKKAFTYIYHLVPFYDGSVDNVIPVYESSYQFQSYICQAYTVLKDKGFTHFYVIADDLILNPLINENDLWRVTGIPEDYCMLPYFIELQNCPRRGWLRIQEAMNYKLEQKGVEVKNILPSREKALEAFTFHKLNTAPIPRAIFRYAYPKVKIGKMKLWRRGMPRKPFVLDYPLVGGYCDTCLITADCMQRFCSYCGAFAAGNLFVELALPTAMVLSTKKLILAADLKLKDGAMWTDADMKILEQYDNKLQRLLDDFPADKMYLHPVKLSGWK